MLLLRLGSPAPTHFCFHPHAPIAASGGLAAAPAGRCHAHAAGRSSPGPASALCSWRHRRLPRGGSGALQLSVVPGIAVNLRRQPGLRRARFDCTRARRPPRGARLAGREGQSPRSEARSAQDRSRAPSIITEVHPRGARGRRQARSRKLHPDPWAPNRWRTPRHVIMSI